MLRIYEAKTEEARKAITADRTKRIPVDAIKAKEDSVRSRKAYEEMRAAYCAASQPSHAANCENADMALEYRAMANAELPSLKSLDKKAYHALTLEQKVKAKALRPSNHTSSHHKAHATTVPERARENIAKNIAGHARKSTSDFTPTASGDKPPKSSSASKAAKASSKAAIAASKGKTVAKVAQLDSPAFS